MRNRTRNSFSYGSTWMSEAPAFSASIEDQVGDLDDRRGLGRLGEVDEVDLLALVLLEDVDVGALVDAR